MEIYNNIKTLVRKYPIPVILNIMGLVLAFTAFIMIMAYVRFEWNFDRCYPKSDCIFKVDMPKVSLVAASKIVEQKLGSEEDKKLAGDAALRPGPAPSAAASRLW